MRISHLTSVLLEELIWSKALQVSGELFGQKKGSYKIMNYRYFQLCYGALVEIL